jgi:hypothetical protein
MVAGRFTAVALFLSALLVRAASAQLIPCAEFGLISNPGFNTAQDLQWWDADLEAAWSPDDANGSASSGSIEISLSEVASAAISQCLPVKGGELYALDVEVRIDESQAEGKAGAVTRWYSDTTCTDEIEDFPDSIYATHAADWTRLFLTPTSPDDAQSVRVELRATKTGGPGGSTFTGNLDNIFFAFRGTPGCADPICGFTGPSASDAQHILRASVRLHPCRVCYCDVDGSGIVSAGDALAALRVSVELPVTLACPACE